MKNPPEIILAATLGDRPFSDSILSIDPSGSSVKVLLSPSAVRSYTGISALSLAGPMVVQVDQLQGDATIQSLMNYDPRHKKVSPSCWDVPIKKGMGALSPDGNTYAFPDFPSTEARITFVVCRQNAPFIIGQFQGPNHQGSPSWYLSLAWASHGSELVAVQAWRPKGLHTDLQLIDTKTMTARMLVKYEDGPVAAAVAADGRIAVLDKYGVEILSPAGGRSILFPNSARKGRQYLGGGMTWLRLSDSVLLSLVTPNTLTSELWRIDARDGSVDVIARINGYKFSGICSVLTNCLPPPDTGQTSTGWMG
jgi:hypothetical protein